MTDERIKELADKWNLFPTDNAWDEVIGFSYDLLSERREWVGLTEEDAIDLLPVGEWEIELTLKFARAIEAKLKEKNA